MSKWFKTSAGERQEPNVSTSVDVAVWLECTMNRVSDGDRSTSLSFLSCGALQSDEIIGILKVLFWYVAIGTRLAMCNVIWLEARQFQLRTCQSGLQYRSAPTAAALIRAHRTQTARNIEPLAGASSIGTRWSSASFSQRQNALETGELFPRGTVEEPHAPDAEAEASDSEPESHVMEPLAVTTHPLVSRNIRHQRRQQLPLLQREQP